MLEFVTNLNPHRHHYCFACEVHLDPRDVIHFLRSHGVANLISTCLFSFTFFYTFQGIFSFQQLLFQCVPPFVLFSSVNHHGETCVLSAIPDLNFENAVT